MMHVELRGIDGSSLRTTEAAVDAVVVKRDMVTVYLKQGSEVSLRCESHEKAQKEAKVIVVGK
jgi:hypothetical protein